MEPLGRTDRGTTVPATGVDDWFVPFRCVAVDEHGPARPDRVVEAISALAEDARRTDRLEVKLVELAGEIEEDRRLWALDRAERDQLRKVCAAVVRAHDAQLRLHEFDRREWASERAGHEEMRREFERVSRQLDSERSGREALASEYERLKSEHGRLLASRAGGGPGREGPRSDSARLREMTDRLRNLLENVAGRSRGAGRTARDPESP